MAMTPENQESSELAVVTMAIDDGQERASKAAEYEQVRKWRRSLDVARDLDKKQREKFAVDRKYAAGLQDEWLVSTNLIGAIIEILMSFTYARDPDIDVTVSESVGPSRYRDARAFAKTLEIVVSRLLKNAKLKKAAKKQVRSGMTVGVGWVKAAFQIDKERDPVIQCQINDLQDNLRRLKVLLENREAGEYQDEEQQAIAIAEQVKALNSKVEVMVNRGLVIDFINADDIQVSANVRELEDYDQADWIAQRVFYTVEEAQELTGLPLEKLQPAMKYMKRDADTNNPESTGYQMVNGQTQADCWVAFWEIWDRKANQVLSLIEGVECWARQPFNPKPAGLRFFPFFMLGFHFLDGQRWPQSDVEQLKKLQDEYCRTRSNFAEHRKRTLPKTVFNEGEISPDDAAKIAKAGTQELVGVKPTSPNTPLDNLFRPMQYPPVDPGLYTTDPIRSDMEKISGAQDAMQSGVQVAKTATEAEIQQTGFGARVNTRRDSLEDMLTELSQYVSELALQVLTVEEVQEIAGPEAFWPENLPIEQIYAMLSIQIRAGSTGRPNTARDRESWGAILPIIQGSITQIAQLRAAGQNAVADAQMELLRETLERSGERIDIERFMPAIGPQAGAAMAAEPGIVPQEIQPEMAAEPGILPAIPTVQ